MTAAVTSRTERPLSASDAEKLLGIPAGTVRAWHHRRRATGLFPIGLDERRRPLFRQSDLLRLRRGEPIRHPGGDHLS